MNPGSVYLSAGANLKKPGAAAKRGLQPAQYIGRVRASSQLSYLGADHGSDGKRRYVSAKKKGE